MLTFMQTRLENEFSPQCKVQNTTAVKASIENNFVSTGRTGNKFLAA